MRTASNARARRAGNKKSRGSWIAGIDEAGRGPFAGPLVLACVWCSTAVARRAFLGIRDSKRLSAAAREEWFGRIRRESAVWFATARVRAATIDRNGMAWALRKSVARLTRRCDWVGKVYLDGGLRAPAHVRQETIVRGDMRVPIIAAASVVAKVVRDRAMVRLHRRYPAYRFDLHKGYGTKTHCAAIRKVGLSPVHRRLFCRRVAAGIRPAWSGAGLRSAARHATI